MHSPKDQLPWEQWALKLARDYAAISKRGEDMRTQTSISLHRRFRGISLADQVGFFVPQGTGAWRGDNPDDEVPPLKFINIVKPTVKNNMSALSSARVAVKNEAANKQPTLRGAANVCDGLVRYFDEDEAHWSGTLQSRIFQMAQTGYGYFVQSRHNSSKPSDQVQTHEWNDTQEPMPGEYACQCGAGGPFDHKMNEGEEPPEQIPCPKCGKSAEVIKAPELATIPRPGQAKPFNPGDNETNVSSCFEHRVDERKSQAGNLRAAQWFEHHYLITEEEKDRDFPGIEFGAAGEWCYALKWKWALESGEDCFARGYQISEDWRTRYERRDIYVLPDEYSTRVEPQDYEMKDADGKVVFSIKRGEKMADKCPQGFCFTVIGERVAPYHRKVDFRDEWSYGCYMPDAHSFWGQPLVELLQIQDDWTTLYTVQIQHLERNSINQITYNEQMYDADAWEQDLVPTAEGKTQEQPLNWYFAQIPALPLTGVTQGLELLFKLLPYTGGAPPESIGTRPPGSDPYHAQLLRKQQALGQLQPPAESGANCKVSYMRNHFKIAQDTWPEERFEYLRTRYGEEWKDDDIEAFLECNINRDVITSFEEGSEVPTDLIERRIEMENVINKYFQAKMPPPAEVMRQYFEVMGIDYDMGGIESDERLADARYEKIRTGLKIFAKQGVPNQPTISIDPQTQQPVPGPSMLIQRVLSHPGLEVKPGESHQVHIDYYVAKEKALMADEMPDMDLIQCLDIEIDRHKKALVAAEQEKSAMAVAAQAPEAAAATVAQAAQSGGGQPQADPQAEAAQAQQQQQMEAEAQSRQSADEHGRALQLEALKQAHEHSKIDKEHNHKSSLEAMKLASQERLAIHAAAQQALAAKEAAKQKPTQSKAA